jgi:hypothetical protein
MARIDHIHERLLRWAEWLKAGDGSGYPVTSVLHPSWSPPAGKGGGGWPQSGGTDGPMTHRLVMGAALSDTKRATLAAVYLLRMSSAEAAVVLECQPDTVQGRIEAIHHDLAGALWVIETTG